MSKQEIYQHNESGFSLIEVLMALVIFTIGLLSANAMQIATIKSNTVANGVTVASVLVSDKIENIMAMDYTDAALTAGTTTTTTVDGFTLTWTVTGDTPLVGCKTVDVNVTFRQKQISLLSFVKSDYAPEE